MLDTTEGGLLKSVEQLFSEIFIPALRKMNHGWGGVASPQSQAVKQDFISSLESFVSVLAGAQECLREKVRIIILIHKFWFGYKYLSTTLNTKVLHHCQYLGTYMMLKNLKNMYLFEFMETN